VALSRRSGRTRFTLILLVLTAVTLLTLDFRGFGPLNSARSAVLDAFAPVGDTAGGVLEPVRDAWNGATGYDELAGENDELRQRVDELEGQLTDNQIARDSFRQLLEQNDISFIGDVPSVKARVVSGAVSNFDATLEIDKGTSAGIQRGMPVVTGRGLIGRIAEVGDDRAVVELLSGGSFFVGFSVVGTNVLGTVRGQGEGGRLAATVDGDDVVERGQIVLTSGVQGSQFPQGIPIGTIGRVDATPGALEQQLEVEMLADTNDLAFVTVLLWQPSSP
jgi:rod shape-determining protein MreC